MCGAACSTSSDENCSSRIVTESWQRGKEEEED